jgi:hypothetical protein
VQGRTAARQRRDPARQRARREARELRIAPQPPEHFDAVAIGLGGEERAIDGADRGPQDDVRLDRALGERAQHSNLMRAEDPASAEDKRDLTVRCHTPVLPGFPARL